MTGGRERHAIVIQPTGEVLFADLTDDLAATGARLGEDLRQPLVGCFDAPVAARSKAVRLPLAGDPADLPEPLLWRWHARGAALYRRGEAGGGRVTWWAVKQALAQRLLGPVCRLCGRACAVDRRRGELGLCGLGPELRAAAATRLWGEEPELGRPGLGVAVAGCGLRCRWCYRADLHDPAAWPVVDPRALAATIDSADEVAHVHFLGGNPDESLPAILDLLARVRRDRPVVWNTHSDLTPAAAILLEGVVDGFLADLKFGPGDCAARLAAAPGYWSRATATIVRFARLAPRLLVRHVALPGHLECCARPAAEWVRQRVPGARLRLLTQYEPGGAATGDGPLSRRLDETECRSVRALGAEKGMGAET